ncbi:unnamed protein product [Acanthosepion pharaonis]|uniref:Uncharacterized protein n=1 Tax=Acanthosepion pharaonis TaxID=158019 RepID=A0A812CCE6_ACAPH|nr:unnamed protein product [Sepia pharaonis]
MFAHSYQKKQIDSMLHSVKAVQAPSILSLHSYQETGHRRQIDSMLHSYQSWHRRQIDSMLHSFIKKLAAGAKVDSMCILIKKLAMSAKSILCLHSYQEAVQSAKSILCSILIKKLAIGKSILCALSRLIPRRQISLCCILIKKLAMAPNRVSLHSYEAGHWPQIDSMLHSYQSWPWASWPLTTVDSIFAFLSEAGHRAPNRFCLLHSYQEAGHRHKSGLCCILIKKLAIGAKSVYVAFLSKLAIGPKSILCCILIHRRQIDSMLHSYQEAGHRRQIDSMLHSYQRSWPLAPNPILCCILIKKLAIGAKSILCCILIKKLAIGINRFYVAFLSSWP